MNSSEWLLLLTVKLVAAAIAARYLSVVIATMEGPKNALIDFRVWLWRKNAVAFELFNCPICLSFWLSCLFILVATLLPTLWFAVLVLPFATAGLAVWDYLGPVPDETDMDSYEVATDYNDR